jgi:Second Messenger Oligonucleotide or Dinucleotide Synthetase domain
MAVHALSDHFARFFTRLNPSSAFAQTAAREHTSITRLIERRDGPAGVLEPHCFLQGSYRQDTAIYTINDVDIVALCKLWYPGAGGAAATSWSRDRIFDTVAAAIAADVRYASRIRYGPTSMVIHVDLDINVEVLPVVFKAGNSDPQAEPFVLYRPERRQWEDGYAREHQRLLSLKNSWLLAGGNFKPMIKVVKHLRSLWGVEVVSFHIECLLYSLPPVVFVGGPADYITNVLLAIAATPADDWYQSGLTTPCGDRYLFSGDEWQYASWLTFYAAVQRWLLSAASAQNAVTSSAAIAGWRALLGEQFFPAVVSP